MPSITRHRTPLGRSALGALGLFALLLAGCGGGAKASSPGATAGGPAAHAAAAAQPGEMAPDYYSADLYPSLLIEVATLQDVEPDRDALARMREVLSRRLGKPAGVTIAHDAVIPSSLARDRWQTGDILALEAQYRRSHTGDRANPYQAVIWVVYLPGQAEADEEGERALGVAYSSSAIAVFPESIERTTPEEARGVVEALTLIHESGHLAGLVNNGVPMVRGHEDRSNPRHDRRAECIMAYRLETADVDRLLERPPFDFCYACRLDLYAAGGPPPGLDEMAVSPLLFAGGGDGPVKVAPRQ